MPVNCIVNGSHKVSVFVKAVEHTADYYVCVDDHSYVVKYETAVTDPKGAEVLFNWKNLPSVKDGFAAMLQSGLVQNQAVGVEKFVDGEPLSLQLQQPGNGAQQDKGHVIYVEQNSSDYYALSLHSPDGHLFYILPSNGILRTYSAAARLTDVNLFLFKISTYACSNPNGGVCRFKRLM